MAAFGDGYRYHVTGLVHDVRGFPTQRPDEIEGFMNRLFRKITLGFDEIQMTTPFMLEDADVIIIAYGSVARSARRAVLNARERGIKAGMLQLVTLFPFPRRAVEQILRHGRSVLVPEMNMGQIYREIKRVNPDGCRVEKLSKMNGQFITPHQIYESLMRI